MFYNIIVISDYLERIEFESLEELCATLAPSSEFDWWIKFIEKNSRLKRFYSIGGCINNDVLKKISQSKNIGLNEISIVFCRNVEVGSLIEFVRKNQNIKKFNFKREYNGDTSIQEKTRAMQEMFGHLWTITSTGDEISLK